MSRSLFCCYWCWRESKELVTDGHHEHVLFGVVDIGEIESFAKLSVVKFVEHLAQSEVVVDVEGDSLQNVNTQAGLHTPRDGFGVEILVGGGVVLVQFELLTVKSIGLIIQRL